MRLQPHDRPDIISRVFKIKLDELLFDLTKKHVLGRVVAYMYTIEFQKRGLPHAHILLLMHPQSKYPTPDDINNIISAEIPSKEDDMQLYHLVKTHMIHGMCGLANMMSPCMKNAKCSKFFPKKWQSQTIVDKDGYPVYRRRDTGNTVMKKNVVLDNIFVVPYNPYLLKKFQAHINMEWCNQGTSVKYLFKYINKGYDRITAAVVEGDNDGPSTTKNGDEIKRPRKKGHTIGRLIWVPPSTGELYYLRMMLTVAKGPTCYEDIKEVGGIVRDSFRDACFEMGFLNDDKEYVAAINEAKDWGSGHFLRKLFFTMLLSGTINRPRHVWHKTWKTLSDGILHRQRQLTNIRDMQLIEAELKNLTLIEIENMLQSNRRSLHEFKDMPYPDVYVTRHVGNRLIYEEYDYNAETERENFNNLFRALTDEQRSIFEKKSWKLSGNKRGGVFFLHGYGGTGKNFMWRTLSSALRSKKKIVLAVASSGIALLLLPGGRIAHSKFKIPVPTLDNSTCNIDKNTEHSQLFETTDVIIWDEAPMAHKNCFEALDRTLKIFGGKVVVFGGDFRQILPVVPRAGRSDIESDNTSSKELAEFSKWILNVGDGEEKEYLSYDSIDRTDTSYTEAYEVLTPEFLSKLRTSGLPNHRIKLKVGTPIMLMRNLDQSDGLCNGTRLIVTRLVNHVIEAKIISDKNIGQSLDSVGLYLPSLVFSHGQLYVAISIVTTKNGLKILIHDKENVSCSTTTNVVYKEVFQSLC
ncbi:uncharacterized protein LOC131624371 [Vicia villosa]|uniref:uncharacterized protein LOC131624371 n=1 Tax=Vicia villosa TaxID=3911 RepID=UPI00273BF2B7|nr:uncharacterized protein LOC131624371 [Vicia villosa]